MAIADTPPMTTSWQARVEQMVAQVHGNLPRDENGLLALPIDVNALAIEQGLSIRLCPGGITGVHARHERGEPTTGLLRWGTATVYVDTRSARRRQRFAIAHELGHFLLGHEDIFNGEDHRFTSLDNDDEPRQMQLDGFGDTPAVNPELRSQAEREASHFAAHLLIPRQELDHLVATMNGQVYVPKIAEDFDVSLPAARKNCSAYFWPRLEPLL